MFYSTALSCLVVGFIVITGCSSSTAKPDVTSDRPDSAAASDLERSKDTQRGSLTESSVSSNSKPDQAKEAKSGTVSTSSLDQLKEGKSTATAASSPLKDVLFEFDRYDLRGDARDILKANADWLKKNPSARVEIEGHCDERGTSEYNLALGAKRAQAARDFLLTLGISKERLTTISYGEEIPVCSDKTEECWRQNRRARFVVHTTPTS